MVLSEEQRQRVRAALEVAPLGDYPTALASLHTAAELHQFVLRYNCNDGLGPLWYVIRSSHCDHGTALYIYWLISDVWQVEERRENSDAEWDFSGLAHEIEERCSSGFFVSQSIAYDPKPDLGWNRVSEYRYRRLVEQGRARVPSYMLEPTPGTPMQRDPGL